MDTLTREPELAEDVRELDVSGPSRPPQVPTRSGAGRARGHVPLRSRHPRCLRADSLLRDVDPWRLLHGDGVVPGDPGDPACSTRPKRWVYVLGLLNLGIIGVWVMSRTVGAPFGPTPWTKEDIGFPDVLSTDLEGFIVLGCLRCWSAGPGAGPGVGRRMSTVGVACIGLVAAGSHDDVADAQVHRGSHARPGCDRRLRAHRSDAVREVGPARVRRLDQGR